MVTIGGRKHWLWRAVDQDGYVLDEVVQARRNTKAAKRLLIRLMKKQACLPSASSPTSLPPMAPHGGR
jgi:putative transposase